MTDVRRLNFGCGDQQPEGWVNLDRDAVFTDPEDPGAAERRAVLWDPLDPNGLGIRKPGEPAVLPFNDGYFTSIVAHHSLQQIGHHDLVPALSELRRVLKPGGWLRISVPDILAAFMHYLNGDPLWFPLSADILDLDARLSVYLTWFGTAKTCFTIGYLIGLLREAGYDSVRSLHGDEDKSSTRSDDPEIVALDARYPESIYLEARNPEAT